MHRATTWGCGWNNGKPMTTDGLGAREDGRTSPVARHLQDAGGPCPGRTVAGDKAREVGFAYCPSLPPVLSPVVCCVCC